MDFTQLVHSMYRHLLLFGAPKTGKTRLAGTLAEKFKLKWIDGENGSITLKQLPLDWQKRIDIVQLPDSRNYPIMGETMLKLFNIADVRICYTHGKVSCPQCPVSDPTKHWTYNNKDRADPNTILVVDSSTQMANSFMNKIMKSIWEKDAEEMPEWKHYAHQGNLMTQVASQVQAGRFHCLFIAHEIAAETPDGKEKLVPVGGTRNFSATFAKYFDEVVYCEVRAKSHKTGSSTTYGLNIVTGSRNNVEIEKMSEPSLLPFFDLTPSTETKAVIQNIADGVKK